MAAAKGAAASSEPATELSFEDVVKGLGGLEDITVPEIEGWFKPDTGAVLAGQIVHYIEIEQKDGARKVLLVKLLAPCKNVIKDGDKTQTAVTFEKGQVVGVGVRHKISSLLDYVANKGIIAIQATEKQNIPGGKTMWKFNVRAKGVKAPLPVPARTSAGTDQDIPF